MKPLFVPAREGDDKRGDGEGYRADRQDRAGDAGNEEAASSRIATTQKAWMTLRFMMHILVDQFFEILRHAHAAARGMSFDFVLITLGRPEAELFQILPLVFHRGVFARFVVSHETDPFNIIAIIEHYYNVY